MNKKSASVGFTLIEVLIGLGLLSMMMLFLFGSLKYGAKSWDAGETKITQTSEMATVHNFFYNQLSAALPLWDDFSDKKRQFSFKGDNKWRFSDGGSPFYASILHEEFLDRVLQSEESFTAGDILRVHIKKKQWLSGETMKSEYEITEVHEHQKAGVQLKLPFRNE